MIKFKFVVFLCVLVILISDIISDIINDIIDDIINETGLEQGEPCPYCRDKIYVKLEQEVKK